MRRLFLTLGAVVLLASVLNAQQSSIYIPRNIVKAYENGTRSYDGKPGPKYWINKADYKIEAELIPQTRTIKGHETIKYYNQSPDSINQLAIRLYQDIMKKGNARDSRISPSDLTDGVKIDTLIYNGKGISLKGPDRNIIRTATNIGLRNLPGKMAPNSVTTIEIKWSLIIPRETRLRMGAYSDSTFYVAYWYPQISVYDDIDGWDRFDYGGEVEFYNDINNYDLELTVPGDYVVWGTGLYQNLDEILKPEIVERYKKAWQADEIIKIITAEDLAKGVTNGKEKNVWKIKADNVSDVAWGASSRYLWDATSVEVGDQAKRVLTDAVYPLGTSSSFDQVALFAKLSVKNLSEDQPGYPFPFPKITVFHGETKWGGGMEIPMMCNNGNGGGASRQAGVTLHEIAHTYFPFFMGTNERKYAWMDEGWATFFTSHNIGSVFEGADELSGNMMYIGVGMGTELDLPTITPSISARGQMLGFASYIKASIAYYFLRDALGDDLFKKCMIEYINRWNGKHPIPYDFFFTFNNVAKEDLSWFWKPWFMEPGYPDLAVKNVTVSKGKLEVTVEKLGNVPTPIDLEITYADGSKENVYKNTSIWKSGNKEIKVEAAVQKEVTKVELLAKRSPDSNLKNNVYEIKK